VDQGAKGEPHADELPLPVVPAARFRIGHGGNRAPHGVAEEAGRDDPQEPAAHRLPEEYEERAMVVRGASARAGRGLEGEDADQQVYHAFGREPYAGESLDPGACVGWHRHSHGVSLVES
jgi:hypothetical protein